MLILLGELGDANSAWTACAVLFLLGTAFLAWTAIFPSKNSYFDFELSF